MRSCHAGIHPLSGLQAAWRPLWLVRPPALMKTRNPGPCFNALRPACVAALLVAATVASGQTLIDINFGVGAASAKRGLAATGMGTNDYWNLYRHYEPKFTPGMPLVADGRLDNLKHADGSDTAISVAVTNAPGVWGNSSGDPMYDTYIFAQNGSNITVTISGLAPGRYHFYLYGHADADTSGEQNSSFTLKAGTNIVRSAGGHGRERLEGRQPLAGARAVCGLPRRAGGRSTGRPRRRRRARMASRC